MALDVAGCRPRGDRSGPVTRSLPGMRGWWPFMRHIGHKIYSALILKQVIAGNSTAKLLGRPPLDACFGCLGPACVDGIWPICAAGTGGGRAGVPHPGPRRHVRLRRAFPDPEASRFKAGLSPPHGVRKAGPGKANPLPRNRPQAKAGNATRGALSFGLGSTLPRVARTWHGHFVFRAARRPLARDAGNRETALPWVCLARCAASAVLSPRPNRARQKIRQISEIGLAGDGALADDRLPVFIAQIRQAKRFHSARLRPKASKGHSPGSGPAGPQNPVRSE